MISLSPLCSRGSFRFEGEIDRSFEIVPRDRLRDRGSLLSLAKIHLRRSTSERYANLAALSCSNEIAQAAYCKFSFTCG